MSGRWRAEDWRQFAACRDEDPDLFFPTAEVGPVYEAQVAEAKRVCARCPVRARCLVEALERIPAGVAGGLDEDERRGVAAAASRTLSAGGVARDTRAHAAADVAAGRSCSVVACEHGVSERTVQRWTRGGAA